MSDERRRSGHGLWPILAFGAMFAMARHMGRRHSMGHRHGGWAMAGPGEADAGFRLPPKIKATLDAWHAQAHQTPEPETPTAG